MGQKDVLRAAETRNPQKRFGERPFPERHGRAVGDDFGKLTPEREAIDRAAENAESDPGIEQPVCVLTHEGVRIDGQAPARIAVERPDEAEIVKTDAAIGRDEQVSRMGIAVKHAENENLVQEGIDEILRGADPRPDWRDRRSVARRSSPGQ
jgi:hypothetical protein